VKIIGQLAQILGELVWLRLERGGLDHLRVTGQGAQQRLLVILGESFQVGRAGAWIDDDAFLGRLT
jgi:hypothetical protein